MTDEAEKLRVQITKMLNEMAKINDSVQSLRERLAEVDIESDDTPFIRGVCQACRRRQSRDVESGEVTDAELVKKKMLLPPKKGGRPRKPRPWDKAAMRSQMAAELAEQEQRCLVCGKIQIRK